MASFRRFVSVQINTKKPVSMPDQQT